MEIRKVYLEKLFLYFIVFSASGWIYEVLVYWLEYGEGLLNRGYYLGPYLPIYGVGGIPIILLTGWFIRKAGLEKKKLLSALALFIGSTVITTIVELISSYILEAVTGYWLWDYNRYTIQFEGRIALTTSIRFGLLFLLGYFGVVPLIDYIVDRLHIQNEKLLDTVVIIIAVLFTIDAVYHIITGPHCTVR